MSTIQCKFKYDEYGNTREIIVYGSGAAVSSQSFVNKGTAFNASERQQLGLQAFLPPGIRHLDDQIDNTRKIVEAKIDDIERFIFIRSLFDRNVTLAHALIKSDLEKYMRIVYTPTIALAVKKFSMLYRQANGLHFYPGNIDMAEDILRRYMNRDIRVAVVTDNQGIIGLGDQGAGGIAICLGKLMLYSQGGGIAPWHCLPISLDVGTDNETLLADKQYLGWRNKRLKGEEYLSFIGRFVRAFRNVFPDALCQWENFAGKNAFGIRDAFVDEIISFNDNIQGTGAMALAATLSAVRAKNETLAQQKFMIFGANAGGVGVCEQLETALLEAGVAEQDALDSIFLADEDGIVSTAGETGYFYKKYAKDISRFPWIETTGRDNFATAIEKSEATVFVTTARDAECLGRTMVQALQKNTDRPVIIPLYSPNEMSDLCVRDIYTWTDGKVLIASSSPVNSEEFQKSDRKVRQGNTILVFPGIGLGVLASGAREVLPEFFTAAAHVIADSVSAQELENGQLLPSIVELDNITNKVALAVAMCAVKHGVSRPCVFSDFQHEGDETRMRTLIEKMRWQPGYLPIVPM